MSQTQYFGKTIVTDKYDKPVKAMTFGQNELIKAIDQYDIIFVNGPAGTGKSFLSLCKAVQDLKHKKYDRISLTRPIVTSGEDMGFLPGDLDDKLRPYMKPLYDNLAKLTPHKSDDKSDDKLDLSMGKYSRKDKKHKKHKYSQSKSDVDDWVKKIEVAPIAYIRGATLDKSFIILDECFTGDTRVGVTVRGYQSRQTIKSMYDDFHKGKSLQVESYNIELDRYERKPVTNVFKKHTNNLINIWVNNKTRPIKCTHTHPYAIINSCGELEWKLAIDLKYGDQLVKFNNNNAHAITPIKTSFDLLLGNLLGDACITKNKSKCERYRMQWIHGLTQSDYNDFLVDIWDGSYRTSLISGYSKKPLVGGTTKSLILPEEFKSLIMKDGVKCIQTDAKEFFTDRALALWVMDDGYYNFTQNHLVLNTQGFNLDTNVMLAKWFTELYNITPSIDKVGKYYVLRFKINDTRYLQTKIAAYVHPNLAYKLPEDLRGLFDPSLYNDVKALNLCTVPVTKISTEVVNDTPVYNIEVKDNNNYLVDGILVHNCQNITKSQMKLFLTRMGKGSKMILAGDMTQTDLPTIHDSGFKYAQELLHDVDGIGIVTMTDNDIVRHKLVRDIIKKYENANSYRHNTYNNHDNTSYDVNSVPYDQLESYGTEFDD